MRRMRRTTQVAYGILEGMKKGGLLRSKGFTIAETLVVLAVTGALFAAIVVTLSGRQQQTQFDQSIQEVKSQIQQVINDVAVGYYPLPANFSCVATLSGPSFSAGSTNQGENSGCIFLGKAIQFGVAGSSPEQFNVMSIAGLQRTTTGDEVTTYAAAKPNTVAPSTSSPSNPDATETKMLEYGLTTCTTFCSSGAPVGILAFVNSLASYSSGSIVSGSQQVNVIPVTGSALGLTKAAAAQKINTALATSTVNPAAGVNLCFVSGSTNQSGLITIGSKGRQLTVTLNIKGNKTCS